MSLRMPVSNRDDGISAAVKAPNRGVNGWHDLIAGRNRKGPPGTEIDLHVSDQQDGMLVSLGNLRGSRSCH